MLASDIPLKLNPFFGFSLLLPKVKGIRIPERRQCIGTNQCQGQEPVARNSYLKKRYQIKVEKF